MAQMQRPTTKKEEEEEINHQKIIQIFYLFVSIQCPMSYAKVFGSLSIILP